MMYHLTEQDNQEKRIGRMTHYKLKSGLPIQVRHITTADAAHFVDIFNHMGPDSRYRRFHQPLVNPSEAMIWREAERIAQAAPGHSDGLIAFFKTDDNVLVPIGASRYISISPGIVEVAMSVRDDFQGQGVGTLLLQLLTEEAHKAGIQKMVGTIQNSNEAMWAVMDRLAFPLLRRVEGTESTIEIDLTRRTS